MKNQNQINQNKKIKDVFSEIEHGINRFLFGCMSIIS